LPSMCWHFCAIHEPRLCYGEVTGVYLLLCSLCEPAVSAAVLNPAVGPTITNGSLISVVMPTSQIATSALSWYGQNITNEWHLFVRERWITIIIPYKKNLHMYPET
jgi:hypothetical protein